MFSIAFSSLFGQDPVYRRPAHAESVGNRARRLAACVHPHGQSGFLLVKRLGSSDVLTASPTLPAPQHAVRGRVQVSTSARLASTPATMRPVAFDVSIPSLRVLINTSIATMVLRQLLRRRDLGVRLPQCDYRVRLTTKELSPPNSQWPTTQVSGYVVGELRTDTARSRSKGSSEHPSRRAANLRSCSMRTARKAGAYVQLRCRRRSSRNLSKSLSGIVGARRSFSYSRHFALGTRP